MYYKKIKHKIKQILSSKTDDNNLLNELIIDAKKQYAKQAKKIKILFAPGFNINRTFTNHDVIIASILHSLGADIYYLYGSGRLISPITFFGGVWGNDKVEDLAQIEKGELISNSLFSKFANTINMNDIVNNQLLNDIVFKINKLDITEIFNFKYNNIELGAFATLKVRNHFMVNDYKLIPNYIEHFRESLINCTIYYEFFTRTINAVNPDRIFSHESFYYPWAIMSSLAKDDDIPFYNYYPFGIKTDAYIYANEAPAMLIDTDNTWEKIYSSELTAEQSISVDKIFVERQKGNVGGLKLKDNYKEKLPDKLSKFLEGKKTAVLYGNVIWDLSALNKEIFFNCFEDLLISTINYFIKNQEHNLIIKAHPAEKHPLIPQTTETTQSIIDKNFEKLPSNILFIEPESEISYYDIVKNTNCSIAWTASVGFESPIFGTPTILTAKAHYHNKGFTFNPESKEDYLTLLDTLLSTDLYDKYREKHRRLARKYCYMLYNDIAYQYGIPANKFDGKKSPINKNKVNQYLSNDRLSQVINSIILGNKITS